MNTALLLGLASALGYGITDYLARIAGRAIGAAHPRTDARHARGRGARDRELWRDRGTAVGRDRRAAVSRGGLGNRPHGLRRVPRVAARGRPQRVPGSFACERLWLGARRRRLLRRGVLAARRLRGA